MSSPLLATAQVSKTPDLSDPSNAVMDAQIPPWDRLPEPETVPGSIDSQEYQPSYLDDPTPGEEAFRKMMDRPLKDVLFPSSRSVWAIEFLRDDAKLWVERRQECGDVGEVDPSMTQFVDKVVKSSKDLEKLYKEIEPQRQAHALLVSKLECAARSMKDMQTQKFKELNPGVDPTSSDEFLQKLNKIQEWKSQKLEDQVKVLDQSDQTLKDHESQHVLILNDMIHAARALLDTGAKPVQLDATADQLMEELSSILDNKARASHVLAMFTCTYAYIYICIYTCKYIYIYYI